MIGTGSPTGLGHAGHRSPRKRRTVDLADELHTVKLRSPMKRTMSELSRMALQRAQEIKNEAGQDGDDGGDDYDDIALADRIIALSKQDGYEPAHQEEEEKKIIRRRREKSAPKLQDLNLRDVKLMKVPTNSVEEDGLMKEETSVKSLFYDGYEGFFEQQKLRTKKTSKNSMTLAQQIDYDEFHRFNMLLNLVGQSQIRSLNRYYRQQYTQWLLELQEEFNLIFYGVGSKRRLLLDFVQSFLRPRLRSRCIVVNGYNPEFHPRALLKMIWNLFDKRPPTWHMVDSVREIKNEFARHPAKRLVLVLHNIDGESLRQDRYHYLLSELATIPQIHLICSMDNVNTPLFWTSSMMANFNFIWHDVTNFQPYNTEISFKDPLSIGKSSEFVGSKGAKYVLSSLTSNAKSLYKNLLLQQLEKIDSTLTSEEEIDNRGVLKGNSKVPVLFREFYELCVSEFIASNEISFRTVLREFVEHKMCTLTRNSAGTEILYIPFTVDEMEKILEGELLN